MQKDTRSAYSITSKVFHHLRLTLLVLIYLCIITRFFIPVKASGTLFMLHTQFGFILFFVIIAAIIWRLFNKKPDSLAANNLEAVLEHTTQALIYLLVFVTPLLGLSKFCLGISHMLSSQPAMSYSMYSVFGVNIIPLWLVHGLAHVLNSIGITLSAHLGFYHKLCAIFILPTLIALHLIALIYHQFILKNNILKRMF